MNQKFSVYTCLTAGAYGRTLLQRSSLESATPVMFEHRMQPCFISTVLSMVGAMVGAMIGRRMGAMPMPVRGAIANPVQTDYVTVQLVSEVEQAQPGSPFLVALRFQIQDEWHIYWKNPGDSGARPMINWQLPEGVTAGDIQWPAPERLPVGP